jgi:dTDP-4-amino-4,6-dideoxygalactose transaminase
MLLFMDETLADKAKHLTTQAKVPHRWDFIHDYVGYNYRMPNINAALGCAQMETLSAILENKRKTAMKYKAFFDTIEGIDFFDEPENCHSNFWLNVILLKNKKEKNDFLQYSNDNGIMTRPVWQLMNKLTMFENCQMSDLSIAKWFEDKAVNLPSGVNGECLWKI